MPAARGSMRGDQLGVRVRVSAEASRRTSGRPLCRSPGARHRRHRTGHPRQAAHRRHDKHERPRLCSPATTGSARPGKPADGRLQSGHCRARGPREIPAAQPVPRRAPPARTAASRNAGRTHPIPTRPPHTSHKSLACPLVDAHDQSSRYAYLRAVVSRASLQFPTSSAMAPSSARHKPSRSSVSCSSTNGRIFVRTCSSSP